MSIAEKLTTIAENEQKVYEAGKESMIDRSKVIEKTANGNPVYIDDASEIPHTVGVKVRSKKNLIDISTYTKLTRYDGVDITSKYLTIDGSLIYIGFDYYGGGSWLASQTPLELPVGKYTLSGKCKNLTLGNSIYCGVRFVDNERSGAITKVSSYNGEWFVFSYTFNLSESKPISGFYLQDNGGKAGTNICFTDIQLELGATATDYVPYNSLAVGASVRLSENSTTYTTDSNGYFECESIAPNMTFECDDVVDIEVDYWKSWGMQTEYNRFWNCITKNNTRTDYQRAFYNWTDEYLRPPFVIKPTIIQYCFFEMPNFRKLEKQYFDFSAVTAADGGFRNNPSLTIIEDCGLPAINQSGLFIGDTKLETIELIRVNENCTFSSANWSGCKALKNIVFEGVIGQSINFQYSPLLTTKSLLSILKALSKDSTYANGKTVTFNTASKAVIEADTACSEQLASAVSAGWTIAYA